jgi:hypothetical protein
MTWQLRRPHETKASGVKISAKRQIHTNLHKYEDYSDEKEGIGREYLVGRIGT